MRAAGARTIPEFILRSAGTGAAAAIRPRRRCARYRNTRTLLDRALTDERYRAAQNRKPPRKLGTHLWLWDCLSCSKCIPACPNDAVFEIEVEPFVGEVPVIEVDGEARWREADRRLYRAVKPTQIAIFADACNDCGNCDVFCPEDGGPYIEKPRFFGSLDVVAARGPAHRLRAHEGGRCVRAARPDGRGRVRADARRRVGRRAASTPVTPVVVVAWAIRTRSCRFDAVPIPSPEPPSPESAVVDLSPYMTLRLLLDALAAAIRG